MNDVEICRWDGLPRKERLVAGIDAVFFASSATQSFVSETAKQAFRERWLGRYLTYFPEQVLLAVAAGEDVVGYVAGALDDPARDARFADLPFLTAFSGLTPRYPAHLHVNLAAPWRGRGIGSLLVAAFADMARASGAPGVHVVTQRGMRNVGFYAANQFVERGATVIGGREHLFLGRDLQPRDSPK
jgi:GNAT superfamily N-acetyltransferase